MSFKLTIPIEKCYTQKSTDEDGNEVQKRYITGLASGTELDRDTEKMAESALHAMREAIDNGILTEKGELIQVPLYNEHRKETLEQLGWLTKAWLQNGTDKSGKDVIEMWVEAELDEDNPKSHLLYKKLTTIGPKNRPTQLGLSISGKVTKAYRQFDPSIKKAVTVFEHIALGEVSVVTRPAYAGSVLDILEKSYKEETGEDLPFHGENPMTMNDTEAQKQETPSDTLEKNTVTETQNSDSTDTTEKATSDTSTDAALTLESIDKAFEPKFTDLGNQIRAISELLDQIKTVMNPATSVVVEQAKSETEKADDTVVTKSDDDDGGATVFKQAVTDVISSALQPIIDKMTQFETSITALEKPVDKSFSVLGEEEKRDPRSEYETRKAQALAAGKTFDPLATAVELAKAKRS